MHRLIALSLAGMLIATGTGSAQVKDLAELFPAKTKFYLEINQIDQVVKEIRPLLKGSILENLPGSLDKIRDKLSGENHYYYLRMMEMFIFATPEGLSEFSRLKGGAIAFTDMPREPFKEPEYVGVLQTGESHLPGMALRAMLTMDRYRKVAEVEGVRIYRHRDYRYSKFEGKGGDAPPAKPEMVEYGPAFAMLPGTIVMGSNADMVGDVVKRMKGKGTDSLTSVAEFKKAADHRQQPGFFVFAEPETLITIYGHAFRSHMKTSPRFPNEKVEQPKEKPAETPMQNLLASLKAFKTIAANLTLKDGTLEMRGSVSFDAKLAGGWPDFFTARTVDLNLFQYAPPNTRAAYSFPLPDGEQFWNKLGKMAPTFETDLSLTLGSGVLDKITHLAMIDVASTDIKAKAPALIWVMQTKDAVAAKALAKDLAVNLKMPAAARDNAVAVGRDQALVDLVLATGAAKKGMLSQTKAANVLKNHDKAHLVLAWSMGQSMIDGLKSEAERARNYRDQKRDFGPKVFEEKFEEVVLQPDPKPNPDSPQQRYAKELDRLADELAKALESMPPLVFSLTKKNGQLLVDGRQTNLKGAVGRLLDVMVEADIYRSVHGYRFGRIDAEPTPPSIAVPTPPDLIPR